MTNDAQVRYSNPGTPASPTVGTCGRRCARSASLCPRLNEATDTEGLSTYEYRLTEYVVFSPEDPNLPVLRFPGDADYWRQFKLGTTHRFELRKGGLGFHQVDMRPVHAKMREYFIGGN
jgi:hypothetical protein